VKGVVVKGVGSGWSRQTCQLHTTFVATFQRVRPTGGELTVFCISVKSWLVLATIYCWMKN